MTDTRPGPDELRMRGILRDRGVGPDAAEPDPPDREQPAPADDPDAWWDRLYPDEPEPAEDAEEPAAEEDADSEPDKAATPRKRPRLRKATPARAKATRKADEHPAVADPRRSLLDAIDAVPHRTRRLISHLTAAGLGWTLGWISFAEDVTAWIRTHHPADPQSIFWYAIGLACLALYRRSRSWWWPLAWLATVPAASAVAGVLLYAPTA